MTAASTQARTRSSSSVRSHVPITAPTTPAESIGTRSHLRPCRASRLPQISHRLDRRLANDTTTTACSTELTEAMRGVASMGPPIPVTPLTKKPSATPPTTRRSSVSISALRQIGRVHAEGAEHPQLIPEVPRLGDEPVVHPPEAHLDHV